MVGLKRPGQATLEMAVAMIAVMTLFFGTFKVFVWFNERLVRRHKNYEATRIGAGTVASGTKYPVKGPEPKKMDLFGDAK